jgi:hypothetical protein
MTDAFDDETALGDDYLDPQFHEVDPDTISLNDNAELDEYVDDSSLLDLESLDGANTDPQSDTGGQDVERHTELAASLDDPSAPPTAQGSLFAASTGDPRVDGAVSRLADLTTSDITEHPAVLEDVHRRLHDALADLDR